MSDDFQNSKVSNNELFLARCERIGFPPERVWEAQQKAFIVRRTRSGTLSDEDRHILELFADQHYVLRDTGEIINRSELIQYPPGMDGIEDKLAFARELLLSARRKEAALRDDELSANEHRALALYSAYKEMYVDTPGWVQECEALAREAMPSVLVLNNDNFDSEFFNHPLPTVVYFHGVRPAGAPKRSLRMERLAQRLAPYGRVARVNCAASADLRRRFLVGLKMEPVLLFDMNGCLMSIKGSDEPLEVLESWVQPYVSGMRRWMTDPKKKEKLERIRALRTTRAAATRS